MASAATLDEEEDDDHDDGAPSIPPYRTIDEYSPVVQEMVMNGFELSKVVRAVELIGENFDDLLAFLMSNGTR